MYAFGEIILVVIGILIALSLNNYNNRIKSEEKITAIFEELLDELAFNIINVRKAGLFYHKNDSLTYRVLHTDVSKEEYRNNINGFYSLTRTITATNLSDDAYKKLLQMSDYIQEDQNDLMKDLLALNNRKLYVEYMSEKVSEIVQNNHEYNYYNYSWSIVRNEDKIIDYMYNDPRYKSEVRYLSTEGKNEHFRHAYYYMQLAIKCYKKIAQFLNKPIDYSLLGFDAEISKQLVGDWVSRDFPGLVHTVYIENNRLLSKNNKNDEIEEYHSLSNNKFITKINHNFLTIVKEGNECIAKRNDGVVFIKVKQLY